MGSISHQLMSLVVNSLGGGDTHTCIQTFTDRPGLKIDDTRKYCSITTQLVYCAALPYIPYTYMVHLANLKLDKSEFSANWWTFSLANVVILSIH